MRAGDDEIFLVLAADRVTLQRDEAAGEQGQRRARAGAAIVERLRRLGLDLGELVADAAVGILADIVVHLHRIVGVAAGLLGIGEQIGAGLVVIVVVQLEDAAFHGAA